MFMLFCSVFFIYIYILYDSAGETFLFTLYPERRKFEWVGIRHAQNIPRSAHMFMAGNFGKLTIGGG